MSRSGFRVAFVLALFGLLIGCDSGGGMGGPNQPPSVTIDTPDDGGEFARADTISFRGSADDPEDDSLTGDQLTWSSDVDGEFGSGRTVATGSLSPTRHTITLTATDTDGETGRDSISIGINGPPSVSIANPDDESALTEGNTLSLEGSGTDPIGGTLSGDALEWASDVDGPLGTGERVSVSDLSAGPHTISLTATDQDGNVTTDSVRVVVESPGFDIRLRFQADFTSAQKQTIRDALNPWTTAITGDLSPSFPDTRAATQCGLESRGIDDLALAVDTRSVDGPGGVLAFASPCLTRTNSAGNFTTSISGTIRIDEADLDNPQLDRIVTHEVGHALGIGVEAIQGWGSNVSGLSTLNPSYSGSATKQVFEEFGGAAYLNEDVPLANTGGQGTFGGHWREANFENELMTGFLNEGIENPLSRLSLAALDDIGYEVDLSAGDSYDLPMPQTAIWLAEADAALSHPASSGENFGSPRGSSDLDSALDSTLVAGSNNAKLWSSDPEDEVYSSLVRFSVPSELPMGVTVDTAAVRLVVSDRNAETSNHDVGLFRVESSWSEGSVTWDGRPTAQDSIVGFDFESCDECVQYVTDLAVDWLRGRVPNYGLALRAPDAESDPTFSVGFSSQHAESPLQRPIVIIEARTSNTAARSKGRERHISSTVEAPSSSERIPFGDDIMSGPVIGLDAEGRVVRTVYIR